MFEYLGFGMVCVWMEWAVCDWMRHVGGYVGDGRWVLSLLLVLAMVGDHLTDCLHRYVCTST